MMLNTVYQILYKVLCFTPLSAGTIFICTSAVNCLCVLHVHAPDYVKLLSCLLTYMIERFLYKITQIHSVFFPFLCFVSISVVLDSLNRLVAFSLAGSFSVACGDLFLTIHHDMLIVTYIVYTRLYSWTKKWSSVVLIHANATNEAHATSARDFREDFRHLRACKILR